MNNIVLPQQQMQMLLHHASLPPKPPHLIPSSPPFSTFPNQRLTFKTLWHRSRTSTTTAAAASADTQPLPQSAIRRIAEKLRSLGYVEDNKTNENNNPSNNAPSPGKIFVPLPTQLPKYRVGHTLDSSWSTPENPVPRPGSGNAIQRFHELRDEVIEERLKEKKGRESAPAPTLAELTLPAEELNRLRTLGIKLKKKLKVGKAGITEGIVNGIHERWRRSEVVRIKCDDICRLNMKRTHDLLEKKTGGLVIWRSGSNIILYRGADYKYPYFLTENNTSADTSIKVSSDLQLAHGEDSEKVSYSSGMDIANSAEPNSSSRSSRSPLIQGVGSPNKVRFQLPGEAQLAEEADRLLEGLGPRFTDWWGYDPLPVDADLLPAVVPGYRRPFRLLPYGVSPKLTNDEMTILKRLGRPLPCHFVLGRNRKHQGLAASIVKLWEKCEIAKIAVKRGVQNTNSELMAEELKRLTGGILLSRDKEFIVLYRGKDFLPAAVSSAIDERRKHKGGEENETDVRFLVTAAEEPENVTTGCVSEDDCHSEDNKKVKVASEGRQLMLAEAAIRRTSSNLSMALAKKARAEKLLAELEKEEIPQKSDVDKEGITEEERYMLRKVGLRMKPFLLLGRRGVFDGTIENMHLHWKYRELVKIITSWKNIEEIHGIARALETESGGILVAVERVSKGYAIIIYRGKNYERPACLRPHTLLSKREAMKRSLEVQRRQSLKLHVLKLTQRIDDLKLQMAKTKYSENIKLAKDLKLGMVQDQKTENIQSTEHEMSDAIPETSTESNLGEHQVQEPEIENEQSTEYEMLSAIPVTDSQSYPCEQRPEESQIDDSTSFNTKDQNDASSQDVDQQGLPSDISLQHTDQKVDQFDMSEQEALPKLVPTRFTATSNMQVEDLQGKTNLSAISNTKLRDYDVENTTSHIVQSDFESGLSLQRTMVNMSERNQRALHLSNRERLLLRKQALKMKKHPLFAVGKSNIVTGVAKTLKVHFEKHPLAIVNVKGRAKGTSVHEVVFKLEQATGAVLVSQEPSKIILYRGWGAEEEPAQIVGEVSRERRNVSAGDKCPTHSVVSPELISAIRLECGLQRNI